jgi:hypothetical protein
LSGSPRADGVKVAANGKEKLAVSKGYSDCTATMLDRQVAGIFHP